LNHRGFDQFFKEYKTFVENRLRKIRTLTNAEDWRYITKKSNPADLITRYINASQLTNNTLWFNGPEFLFENKTQWM